MLILLEVSRKWWKHITLEWIMGG